MKLALYPLVQQFQYRNGTNLVAGRIYVYYRGRTRLATIYKDQNGTIAQNPLTCDADGRAPCFVDSNYQYTIVVCDARGKELFSQDLDADNAININDALSGDSKLYIINSDGTISVNATSGDSWIQYDLGTYNKPLGVTEPLYWEKDDEEASIIGLHTDGLVSGVSADLTELSGKVNELSANKMDKSQSAEFYPSNNPSGFIGAEGLSEYQPVSGMTAYQEKGDYYSASNPSGFISDAYLSVYAKKEELTAYQSAGDYYSASNPSGFINSDAISDMATTGFVAEVSADITAMIPTAFTGDYLTKESADTLYQPIGDYVNQNELSNVSADITAMIPTALTGDYLDKASADKLYYGINNPSGFITCVDLSPYQTITGMTAYQSAGNYYSASNPSGFITNDAITGLQPAGDYATNTELCAVSSTITGMIPSGEYELCAGNGIELVDDPNAKTTTISVTAQGSDTISYSAKPTDNPIYASGNDLNNVDSIQGKSNLAIVPNGVLQVPNIITAANGNLIVQNAITATNGFLQVPNVITAAQNGVLQVPNVITATPQGLTAAGLSADSAYGLTANGLTADAHHGFSANGISVGKQGPLCIEGEHEIIDAKGNSGFTFSSQNTAFGTAQLTTASVNQLVKVSAPKFEAKNVSGAGFSIEASGAKGYDESGNVVWDTNNLQVKNIISYADTKTAAGGLSGNIILTTMPSTNASNLTSAPYVIMDASQASYFAAYGPSAQTPTVSMYPSQITFDYAAGNAKTTVGYNDIKQEASGSAWTLTGSIQKRELEYDANTSAITAIAGSAIGGQGGGGELPEAVSAATDYVTANSANIDATVANVSANSGAWGGSALPISAGPGIKLDLVNDTLVASVSGYVWQSASLFHTDTPVKQTTYTLSDNCSNYDRLDVDFYDINDWRTVMECPIPSNLDASGTRGGYFSVVTQNTATNANIWFKAFNWTAAGTTWSCYCSELAGQGGSTTQTINANQPDNPPKVVNIIGWKRVGGN